MVLDRSRVKAELDGLFAKHLLNIGANCLVHIRSESLTHGSSTDTYVEVENSHQIKAVLMGLLVKEGINDSDIEGFLKGVQSLLEDSESIRLVCRTQFPYQIEVSLTYPQSVFTSFEEYMGGRS